MVSSPMYERLKVFMEAAKANRDLDAWNADHQQTIKGLQEAVERLKQYRDSQGFVGETAEAMNAWVDRAVRRIDTYADTYRHGHSTYQAGRLAMASALHEANLLSPTLLDSATEAMRDDPVVMVPRSSPGGGIPVLSKRFTTGAAYVDAVEAQANAQREAAATRILERVNSLTGDLSSSMQAIRNSAEEQQNAAENRDDAQSSTDTAQDWADSASHSFGRSDGRNPSSGTYPGGFAQPWWSEADAAAAQNRTVASGAVPTQEPAYGETGSRTNPITDPQDLMSRDLLHTRVNGTTYRNGVVGGHTPAPPADVDHPLWRLNGGAASDASAAGRLGGVGALGAGALGVRGAAQMGTNGAAGGLAGMRGITGTTNGLGAAGASALKAGSYSGSGFGSYTPPAGANGDASGAGGAAGRGSGGFMGAGAGAGAGAGKEDKKRRRRQYMAFKFEDDEDALPAGYVNPLSQTYGSDTDIAPARRTDDGWDPRQW